MMTKLVALRSHLSAIHKFHGGLTEEEVDMVLIFQGIDEMRLIEVLEVILFSTQPIFDDKCVSGRKICHCSRVQFALCKMDKT